MKAHQLKFVVALVLFTGTATAYAQTSRGSDEGWYYGVKGGWMNPKDSNLDNAINSGGLLGYNVPGVQQLGGLVGIEGDISLSAIQGDASGGGEWDVQTIAGYGVYRSSGPLYVKGKLGISHQRLNVDVVSGSQDDTTFSWGLGVGQKIGQGRAELEYTQFKDLNFISIGYIF